ncbi:MAG: hypothetical protein C0596_13520 [Marinilabiliales bacterium]|nr:MAG: hypothetical protein C0596_13520 [Marinilabiliales bacterium]
MGKKSIILFLINFLVVGFITAAKDEPVPEIETINQMLCDIAETKSDDKKNELNANLIEYFNEFLHKE